MENIIPSEVDAKAMVSMKVDLGIPWKKIENISG